MTDFQILLDAPGTTSGKLQVAKLGEFEHAKYGKFTISRDDVQSWSDNLAKLPGNRALIDLDHSADRSPRSTEAAGWITSIGWDGDTPMADVEWTPLGKQAIQEGRYAFFSPTYGDVKDEAGGTIKNALLGGALTNRPHLNMAMISLASADRVERALDADPAERFYQHALDGALGDLGGALLTLDISQAERDQCVKDGCALPDGSYPIRNAAELHSAAVLAASGHGDAKAARDLIRKRAADLGVTLSHLPGFNDDAKNLDGDLLTLLELDQDADDKTVLGAIQALKGKTLEQALADKGLTVIEPTRLVQLESEAKTGRDAVEQMHQQKFETAWQRALDAGRVVMGQRDIKLRLYAAAPEDTLHELDTARPIVSTRPSSWDNQANNPEASEAPAGVNPNDWKLDQEVKHRLAEEGKTMADYPKVLEAVLAGSR